MTLPQKGSRKIVVDGIAYRWRVRHRPTYSQAICESGLRVAAERVDAPHCVLVLLVPALRRDNWSVSDVGYVAAPADVARWIRLALTAGWVPQRTGKGFELSLREEDLAPAHPFDGRLSRFT